MIASLFIKNRNLFQKSSKLVNTNIYKFSFQDKEKVQQTEEEKEAEINENMNTYFKNKVQEIFANKVQGYQLMQQFQFQQKSTGEIFYFKQQLFKTTFLSTLGGLGIAYIYQALYLPILFPLVGIICIPKFLLVQSPMEVVKCKDTGFIKIENSYNQKALYGLMTACTFTFIITIPLGFIPIFALYNAYLFNLQQKNALTEVNGVKGIAALNLMFFLLNYTSQDLLSLSYTQFLVSLSYTQFLGDVGNNIFLFSYTFFICNQQKVSELAVKHGFLDELNTVFASFRYLKLLFKSYSWKHISLVVALAIFLILLQQFLRNQRRDKKLKQQMLILKELKIDPYKKTKDKTFQQKYQALQVILQSIESSKNQKKQNDEDTYTNKNSNQDNDNNKQSSFSDNKFENNKDDFNNNDKDNFNNNNYNNDDQWGSKIDFSSSSKTNEVENFQFDNTISYGKQKFSDE